MRSTTTALIIALAQLPGCGDLPATPPPAQRERHVQNRIPKSQLQEMFDNISAKTEWDMDGDMLWGYFFTDSDRTALERAAQSLEAQGYCRVDLY